MKLNKLFFITLAIIILLSSFVGCSDAYENTPTSSIISSSEQTHSHSKDTSSPSDHAFEMEQVGYSSTSSFSHYRDVVTDVLYVSNTNSGGLAVMLDPETGLPLTYTRYMEIYNGL